ncbi:MAG: hypothetical protein FWJ93_03290 [Micromonosporaceae bacterium]
MSDPLATLAMTGATTLVAAMATSAWDFARSRVAALLGRHGDGDVEARLQRSADRVSAASEPETVRREQVTRWRDDLVDVLREHPDAQDELRALIAELRTRIPQPAQQWMQQVTAHAGGSAFGALGPGSSVHVHYHHSDGTS